MLEHIKISLFLLAVLAKKSTNSIKRGKKIPKFWTMIKNWVILTIKWSKYFPPLKITSHSLPHSVVLKSQIQGPKSIAVTAKNQNFNYICRVESAIINSLNVKVAIRANRLTGFYMMTTLVFNESIQILQTTSSANF